MFFLRYDKNQTGALSSKLFDDLERVREGTGDKVALAVQYTAQFFGGFIVAFSYDWKLTLIMMSLSPFLALCGAFLARLMAKSSIIEVLLTNTCLYMRLNKNLD